MITKSDTANPAPPWRKEPRQAMLKSRSGLSQESLGGRESHSPRLRMRDAQAMLEHRSNLERSRFRALESPRRETENPLMSKKKKIADLDQAPVTNLAEAKAWAAAREVTEIECLVPDLAGVARGKIMPASKFFEDPAMALPSSIFMQTISGEYPEETAEFRYDPSDGDIELRPDFTTLCDVPWAREPTAQVIHDAVFHDGRAVEIAPRQVLKRVIGLYAQTGWEPVVAPELEFYLVKRNIDPDYPLEPPSRPLGPRRGRPAVLFDLGGQRVRRHVRGHLRLRRGAAAGGRHPDPRGGRGADGDQPAPRRPAGPGRPGLPA